MTKSWMTFSTGSAPTLLLLLLVLPLLVAPSASAALMAAAATPGDGVTTIPRALKE